MELLEIKSGVNLLKNKALKTKQGILGHVDEHLGTTADKLHIQAVLPRQMIFGSDLELMHANLFVP